MSLKLKNLSRWLVLVSNAAIVLLLISTRAYGQTTQNEPLDSTAYSASEITVHGRRMVGYIKGNIFYLASLKGKIVLKGGEGCYSWKFEDFNGDGFKDILLEYNSNTPDEMDLYLYLPAANNFVFVKNFYDFPAAKRIKGTHFYYSHHHSGCADEDWDSDLFCLRDFKAIRLGNISGVGCADKQDEREISINKVWGDSLILVKKYPISIIQRYRDYKWGFIRQYWTRNYKFFQDKISLASADYFITEEFAVDTVLRLPEVIESCAYFKRATKGKRQLFPLIYGEPDAEHPYYWVVVGEDNGMCFVTHFGFFVYVNSGKVFYYDTINGTAIDLRSWRKNLRRK